MILTNKAKVVFLIWFNEYYTIKSGNITKKETDKLFETFQEIAQNVYIFKWFKSMNIIKVIDLDQTTYPKYQYRILKYTHFGNFETIHVDGLYGYEEQAEVECIEKLNELYNNDFTTSLETI